MRRRHFITLLGGAAAWPLAVRAQQRQRVRRIGVLMYNAEDDPEGQARVKAFQQELQRLGWNEGGNVQIDYRWTSVNPEHLQAYSAELIPRGIIRKLNAAAVQGLADPVLGSRLAELGFEVFPREQQTPEVLGAFVTAGSAKWWPLIKEFGISAE